MRLHRFEVPGLAHYSYVLESGASALIVDPKRDIDTYVHYAAERSLRITHILETHIHADYASGARELAQATGAELWLSVGREHFRSGWGHVHGQHSNRFRHIDWQQHSDFYHFQDSRWPSDFRKCCRRIWQHVGGNRGLDV